MMQRILVVDDHATNLKLAADILQSEGYQVATAEDAMTALAAISGGQPQLILLDLALPGMDGLSLTRKLKADEATCKIQILALTAFAMIGDEEKARAAGCNGYISKPIHCRVLVSKVKEMLDSIT